MTIKRDYAVGPAATLLVLIVVLYLAIVTPTACDDDCPLLWPYVEILK